MSGSGTASGMRPELLRAAQAMLVDYLGFSGKERLLITTDTAGDQAVVQAITAAAIASGGRPVVLTIPQLPFQGKLADPYLPAPLAGAAHQCDIWIDLTFPYIAGADLHDRAMKNGAIRYLLASDLSAEGLRRLFSGVDLDAYFALNAAFDAFMATAVGSEIRITTTHGTDVRYRLTKPAIPRPRQVQAPGMYLLPGAASMLPDIETVQGEIAIETVFHEFYTPLAQPIKLSVDGRIRSVQGGGPERVPLERALRRAGGGEFGYIIHFTHGLHPAARFTGRSFVEDMRVIGSNAVGMGLPWWQPGGGENHPDAVISSQSVSVDGQRIIADGVVVSPSALADAAAALTPTFR